MTIAGGTIARYDIPFATPLRLTGRELAVRSGYIVRLVDDCGRTGCGEIAPLPGLHRESPEEAAAQAAHAVQRLTGHTVPPGASVDTIITLPADFPALFPSVRTGVEMALLTLYSTAAPPPLPALPGSTGRPRVSLNGLVTGTPEAMRTHAQRLVEEGYRTLKLKVGRLDIGREIALVREVRTAIGPDIALRLDANRSWSLPTAVEFGRAVAPHTIDYIEEPLADAALLPEFAEQTGIRIALDESLADGTVLPTALNPAVVAALVLKPSVAGGLARTIALIRLAQQYAVDAVLSSAFETGVALGMYTWLASVANRRDVACGLDTYKFLARDILCTPFAAVNGSVDVRAAWYHAQILREEELTPVEIRGTGTSTPTGGL